MSKLLILISLLALVSCGTTSKYNSRTQQEARNQTNQHRGKL